MLLFRDDPWLAFDLLGLQRPVVGTPVDRRAEIERDTHEALKIKLRYPDLVLVYRAQTAPDEGIVICIEAQKKADPKKRWRIPAYQGALADDHELQTWVFVVSFSRPMSAALESWRSGPPPRVDAHTLDVDTVAPIHSLEQARERPAATVLAAALHGYEGDLEGARVGIRSLRGLPEQQRQHYTATILAALPKRERDIMIGELPVEERDELWEIERRSGTYLLGHSNGLEEGLERGRTEGLERGRSEGLERGRTEGLERGRTEGLERGRTEGLERGRSEGRRVTLIEMIVALLEVRGLSVDADSEARIRGCDSVETLQRWARRAREVSRAAELFEA